MNDQFYVPLHHKLPSEAPLPARLLGAARQAGLPVPDSFLLLDEAYQVALQRGLIHSQPDHTLTCPDPDALTSFLNLPALSLRIPSAADSQPIGSALCEVWARPAEGRRDVLLMPALQTQHAGTAFTETDFDNDYVIEGAGQELPRQRFWERPENTFITRLQKLLRGVRRVFGAKNWEIEWADDGSTCWLMQIRRLTAPAPRNETFVACTHLLPPHPSVFMTGIIAATADDISPELSRNRKLIEVFYGRPYLNLSLHNEIKRRLGSDSSPLHRLTRAGTLVAEVWRTLQKSPQTLQQVRQRAAAPGASLSECVAQVRWLYTTLVQGEYTLSLLLSLLNSDYSEPTLSTAIYTDLVPLRDLTSQQDEVRLALIQGKLPKNKKFLDLWDLYLEKHGHRGIYETDIASPRYRENPRPLLDSLLVSPRTKPDLSSASPPGWWVRFLWSAIQAQENLRYEIMKGFEQSRARLLKLAGLADADLWMLTPEEVMQLETGWQPDEAFFQKRCADLEHDRRYDLPDQFSRFDNFGTNVSTIEDEQQMRGISLNQGRVRGVAWVLDEPDTHLPEDFDEGSTILVTRAVDAGWIPTFSHVAGVVVETGDDFSLEAMLLRGIGVPAITHVEGVTHKIQTGDEIVLRADQGIVERCHLK